MVEDNPLVTIGIPFHNAADTLLDAIRSIFAQTYTNWELILAADGSTDGSEELARRIQDYRVRVIGDGTRRYISYRLNQVTREARGKFIARMDADDLSAPERIAKQVNLLQSRPEISACGTGQFLVGAKLELVGQRINPTTHEEICADPLRGFPLLHATLMVKADWFRQTPYDERYHSAQEWDLYLRTYRTSRFANLTEPLYLWRSIGTIGLERYTRAKTMLARILITSNPEVGSIWKRLYHAARQYAQMAGFLAVAALYRDISQCRLSGRRGHPVTADNAECFEAIKKCVLETELPLTQY